MTSDERKALSFVALLLGLSVVARAVNSPSSLVVSGATAVNIEDRLQQNQQVGPRAKKWAKPSKTTPATSPARPNSSIPAWRRGPAPASVIEYKAANDDAARALDINSATVEELDRLPGIGPTVAQRIVEYRTAHGGFRTFEELDSVKGIGPALLAKLKPVVRIR